jgi:hypothetical protein
MNPVVFCVVERIDHFGHKFILFRYLQHGSCVLVSAAVVSC